MIHMQSQPRKIERIIEGWRISLEGDNIMMVTPTGQISKIRITEPVPLWALVSKETHVLTKLGYATKMIKIRGPELPPTVWKFVNRLKKAYVLR